MINVLQKLLDAWTLYLQVLYFYNFQSSAIQAYHDSLLDVMSKHCT